MNLNSLFGKQIKISPPFYYVDFRKTVVLQKFSALLPSPLFRGFSVGANADEVDAESSVEGVQAMGRAKPSKRYLNFKERLASSPAVISIPKGIPHPAHEKEPLPRWPNNTNPHTGEIGGPPGPEPTRYGDWESKGRVSDF